MGEDPADWNKGVLDQLKLKYSESFTNAKEILVPILISRYKHWVLTRVVNRLENFIFVHFKHISHCWSFC